MDDIPVSHVLSIPYEHGKPFVIEEDQTNLGTQMYNFQKWYLQMSKKEMRMFGVKYRDQDFFCGEDNFQVDFKVMHAIYRRQALAVSILTIWIP